MNASLPTLHPEPVPTARPVHRPIRALHVLAGLNRGGVENWIVEVVRRVDPQRLNLDLLVQTEKAGDHEAAVEAMGVRILRCPGPEHLLGYGRRFQRLLQEYGPYDIVHCHLWTFSGLILRHAARVGVPHRLAHSHSQGSPVRRRHRMLWPLYAALMRRWIRRYATLGLAASETAATALFGPDRPAALHREVLPCGIDLGRFEQLPTRTAARRGLGIPDDGLVIGHIGRFVESKNHVFILEIARALLKREPAARLLLVGDGPTLAGVRTHARDLGDRIVFAGSRPDVHHMLAAMDAFVFPSRFEGLGLAAVEAQAAGLPVVIADHLPAEIDVIPTLVQRLSLSAAPTAWADALHRRATRPEIDRAAALDLVRNSPFNIERSVDRLIEVYEMLVMPGGPTD